MAASLAIVWNRERPVEGESDIRCCNYECRMQNAKLRMTKSLATVTLFVLLPSAFCILNSSASDFLPALPGYQFEFPRDHGAHDEYRTEWWYYTGHLQADSGRRYGFELTFFRVGVVPPDVPQQTNWDLRNLSLAHFAITDVD